MEEQVVEADHANEEEPQRTTLMAPPGDYVPVPDAIWNNDAMMNNGAKRAGRKDFRNIEQESVSVKKILLSVFFTQYTHTN